jgi:WD40 repeat protein
MNSSTRNVPSSAFSWKTWFLWVVVCALEPIFYAIASMAFQNEIPKHHPHSTLLFLGIAALILICLPLPVVLQRSVLRCVAPSLGLRTWIVGMLFAYGVYVGLIFLGLGPNQLGHALHIVLTGTPTYEANKLAGLAKLAWLPIWLITPLISSAMAFIPALILGKSSNHKWYIFLIAGTIGISVATLAEQIYGLYLFRIGNQELNDLDWLARFNELSFRAGIGAVWGAASAATLACFINADKEEQRGATSRRPGPVAMAIAAGIVVLITPAFLYSMSHQGVSAGFPALQKAISVAPPQDNTTGQPILQLAHNADFSPPPYPVTKFAPDGKSFIALSAERTLQRIDIASGAKLGQIGEALKRHENYSADWSRDGRFFVLRTDGDEVKVSNANYTRHRNRLRVFALPEYRLLGEFSYRDKECFAGSGHSVMFEYDGNSFWSLCKQYVSQKEPDDVIAIRISVPAMTVMDVRRYGENLNTGGINDLSRIGDDVGYSQSDIGNSTWVKIRSLTRSQDLLTLRNLTEPHLAGSLTLQGIEFEEKKVTLRYCGDSTGVSDPGPVEQISSKHGHKFCRLLIFDILTGVLLKKLDRAPHWGEAQSKTIAVLSTWQENSKVGQTTVKDISTNLEVQKLVTQTQRPLGFSPDEKWLVMYALDEKLLRIYHAGR